MLRASGHIRQPASNRANAKRTVNMRSIVLTLTLGLTAVGLISAAALPQTPSSVLANQRQDVPSLGCQLVGVHAIVRRDPYASPDPLEHRLARSASTHESNKRTKSAERDTAGPSSLSPREPPLVYCVTGRLTGGQFSRSFALSVNVWNVYWEVDRPALGSEFFNPLDMVFSVSRS